MAVRDVKIVNRLGIHMRPATKFVETANRFPCTVTVSVGGQKIDGKSIMDMMLLAAMQGAVLHLETEGPEAEACLDALAEVVARFDEK